MRGSKVQVISNDSDILFLQLYKNVMTDYGEDQFDREMIWQSVITFWVYWNILSLSQPKLPVAVTLGNKNGLRP